MNPVDQLGLGQHQNLGAVLEVAPVLGKRLAAKLLFIELMGVDERPHRPVQQHDPPGKDLFEPLSCGHVCIIRHRQ